MIPGTPGYGDPFLGLHCYTWAFICFSVIIGGLATLAGFQGQYHTDNGYRPWQQLPGFSRLAIVAALLLVAINAIGSFAEFAECGPGQCPDNPTSYWLLG